MIRLGIFLTIFPQLLWAQTAVPIQSGEHENFTRLVLTIDPDSNWEMRESRGKVILDFPDMVLDFGTSAIFDRIPTTRILAVKGVSGQDGSFLEIEIPCDCPARVFAFGAGHLVIDVQDGGPLAEIVEIVDLAEPPAAYEYWQPEILVQAPLTSTSNFFNPPEIVIHETPSLDAEMTEDIEVQAAEMMASDLLGGAVPQMESEPNPEMLARIAEAQEQLLQQLTRAADQGLVDFVPPIVEIPEQEMVEEIVEATVEENLPLDPALLNQLSARTAYDDAAEADLVAIINEFAKPQCLYNSDFSMQDWQNDTGFSAQIAILRAEIYGEFDRINEDAILGLAKLYIVNGLGAEATAILAEIPEQPEQTAVLFDLAEIVDGGFWQINGPVAKGENCGGDHEMWFLAGSSGRQEILETAPVIEAFSRYPIGIRLLIGPRIANVMLDSGEFDAAHQILEIVRRAAPPVTVPMQMATANVLDAGHDDAAANLLYSAVAMSQETDANQATFALARAALDQDEGITHSLLTDLETIVFSQRDTEIGVEARLWEIKVNARINGLTAGLEMISTDLALTPQNSVDLLEIVTDLFIEASADQQGHLNYVDAILAYQHMLSTDQTADASRNHMAQELIMLGLPNIALQILQPALSRADITAELTAANAHLAQFEPDLALAIVNNHSSDAATEIALKAYLLKSDHAAIAAILDDPANAQFIKNDVAWRAGDWQNIQGEDKDATMAAFMQGQELIMPDQVTPELSNENAFLTDVDIAEEPNLQAARNLLEVNRASRAFIEDVLAGE